MKNLCLNGIWKLKCVGENTWIEGRVPGSVFHDLLTAGKIDDPFYRDNEDQALEIASHDYEYTRTFTMEPSLLGMERVVLRCEGIDTLSEIRINGKVVANTDNMHRTYEFDVKTLLREGENEISIVLFSPLPYIEKKQAENTTWGSGDAVPGFQHLRKAHSMFGWDWGPKIPDLGIWRNLSIFGYREGRLEDVYITQKHRDGAVDLDVRVSMDRWCKQELDIQLKLTAPDGSIWEKRLRTDQYESRLGLAVEKPELWWPNGFGSQPLYQVEVTLADGEDVLDRQQFHIGLRTMTVRREKDEWGESFEMQVNGVSIFSMGADYIPEDNLLPRCSRERTERLIKDCVAANFNSIRVWGGGHYPEDYFYDLCDQYGLIVWQDLMFACAVYVMTDAFAENIRREAIDNMKRLRHHASLGLWCGNNEMEWGWVDWGLPKAGKLCTDYIKQFEVLLPQVAKETDPNTFYWLASPSSGGGFDKPNDENMGDVHYWDVWHGLKPFTEYRKFFFRFVSEFGFQSFPGMKTVESFTLPEDRNIFSHVMERHQKNGEANGKILFYLSQNFKYPKDFDSLLYTSQILQAEAIRYGVEHWRRHRGRCMGAIYWQLNDCWPVASWSSIDYYGRWKALHYFARRFFAPVLLSACEEGTGARLVVSNETTKPVKGRILWLLRDHASEVCREGVFDVAVAPLSVSAGCEVDFADILHIGDNKRKMYVEYALETDAGRGSEGTFLFCRAKHFSFLDPKLSTRVEDSGDRFVIRMKALAYAKYVELDLTKADGVFSDNYFDLSAGDCKSVEVKKETLSKSLTLSDFEGMLTVRSLFNMA